MARAGSAPGWGSAAVLGQGLEALASGQVKGVIENKRSLAKRTPTDEPRSGRRRSRERRTARSTAHFAAAYFGSVQLPHTQG